MYKPSYSYWIEGSSPVSRPSIGNDHPVAALMHAIRFALGAREGLDYFIRAVLPPYPQGVPGGGDPGWLWYALADANGQHKVVVEVHEDVAPPLGAFGEYAEDVIRYEIRAALNNLCVKFPQRKVEIEAILKRFCLNGVMLLAGLEPIPSWDSETPPPYILNDL
ncbi:hypothetical protein NHH82_21435 [Oxalobacteraceae bacterium OTU3REALA1]|nr:hypothetical protein NHH82_21435 [Oxalobacteraceae bacterium OTU3REALA1]